MNKEISKTHYYNLILLLVDSRMMKDKEDIIDKMLEILLKETNLPFDKVEGIIRDNMLITNEPTMCLDTILKELDIKVLWLFGTYRG